MTTTLLFIVLPLAQAADGEPRGYAWSWAIILLGVILGMVAALTPAKRDGEVRKAKVE